MISLARSSPIGCSWMRRSPSTAPRSRSVKSCRRTIQATRNCGGICHSQQQLGGILLRQGHLDEALTAFNKALGISEKLARADPANLELQRIGDAWIQLASATFDLKAEIS